MVKANNSDRSRLARFWSSASGFWRGKTAITSWALTIGLLLIGISQLTVQYRLNYWNRDFFNALARRDSSGLWDQVVIFIPLACLSVALTVTSVWARMTTQRKWREWLTTNILDRWLSRERYRRLASVSGEYQNAEYRIAYDARLATDAPVDLTLGFITSALTALIFTGVLWNVGGSLTLMIGRLELTIPGYLVVGVGIYALAFTGVMMAMAATCLPWYRRKARPKPSFLPRPIKSASPARARRRVPTTPRNSRRYAAPSIRFSFAGGNCCGSSWERRCLPDGPAVRSGVRVGSLRPEIPCRHDDAWQLTQASAAFVTVQVAFNWLVDNYQRLSDWRSAANRVAALLLAFDELARSDMKNETGASK